MNARAAFCVDSLMADQHASSLSADQQRDEREASVAKEIADAMREALCLGRYVKVPVAKLDKHGDDIEGEASPYDVLFDHIGDDAAKPLLVALLRTNVPEARALVKYAAERHAWFNADEINNIRDRVAMEA